MKKRILFCGESSWLNTGFSIYNRQILERINATDKYTLAEFGNYGNTVDPQAIALPWKFYGNLPRDKKEAELYRSRPTNQFGAYKFDAVVSDFQPDIVFACTDPWMVEHIMKSQFRDKYKTVLTPTVDSAPQKQEWVDNIYNKSDIITTYSRFGKRTLEGQGVKVTSVTSPGVDLEIFSPKDKYAIKSDWGLQKSLKIIGTVMRNQKRKCFPELFQAYAKLRRANPNVREIQQSVLLCHTSWPDVGWNLPELIQRNGLNRHVIFTYKCDACSRNFFSWFIPSEGKSGNGKCVFCGEIKAHMPNTHSGVSTEELSEIYNVMDIYVQPAICEGWALPIVEAKACGVPGLYSNYSAMEDHVENGGGLAIDIGTLYTEAETMAVRSLPDVDSIVSSLKHLLTNSKERKKMGEAARECSESLHNWSLPAQEFERIFDELETHNRKTGWDKRPEFKIINNTRIQPGLNNEQFVITCYRQLLRREPDQEGFKNWMKSLASGNSRESVESFFRGENSSHNKFETIRWEKSLEIRGFDPQQTLSIESAGLTGFLV